MNSIKQLMRLTNPQILLKRGLKKEIKNKVYLYILLKPFHLIKL